MDNKQSDKSYCNTNELNLINTISKGDIYHCISAIEYTVSGLIDTIPKNEEIRFSFYNWFSNLRERTRESVAEVAEIFAESLLINDLANDKERSAGMKYTNVYSKIEEIEKITNKVCIELEILGEVLDKNNCLLIDINIGDYNKQRTFNFLDINKWISDTQKDLQIIIIVLSSVKKNLKL